jgi:hypothetical protein
MHIFDAMQLLLHRQMFLLVNVNISLHIILILLNNGKCVKSTNKSGVASVSPPAYISGSSTPIALISSKFGNGNKGAELSKPSGNSSLAA